MMVAPGVSPEITRLKEFQARFSGRRSHCAPSGRGTFANVIQEWRDLRSLTPCYFLQPLRGWLWRNPTWIRRRSEGLFTPGRSTLRKASGFPALVFCFFPRLRLSLRWNVRRGTDR
jgi:hypothetical protein